MAEISFWRLIAFAASMSPGLIVGLLILRLGEKRFTTRLFGVAVASGAMISLIPAALSELETPLLAMLSPDLACFLRAFVSAGLVEEASKLAASYYIVRRHYQLRSPRDLVLGTAAVALGFALLENAAYVLRDVNQWESVALLRAVCAVPIHALIGFSLGWGMTKAESAATRRGAVARLLATLLTAATLHGLYDYPLMASEMRPPRTVNFLAGALPISSATSLGLILLLNIVLISILAARVFQWCRGTEQSSDDGRSARALSPAWLDKFLFGRSSGLLLSGFLALLVAMCIGAALNLKITGALPEVMIETLMPAFILVVVGAGFLQTVDGLISGWNAPRAIGISGLSGEWRQTVLYSSAGIGVGLIATAALAPHLWRTIVAHGMVETAKAQVVASPTSAIKSATTALNYRPGYAPALIIRAAAYQNARQYELALANYTEVLKTEPENYPALVGRMMLRLVQKDTDGALVDVNKAISLKPREPGLYIVRGQIRESKNDPAGASVDFINALAIQPNQTTALMGLAVIAENKGDPKNALSYLDRALQIDPKNQNAYSFRGRLRFQAGEYKQATDDLLKARYLEQPYVLLWLFMARTRGGAADRQSDPRGAEAKSSAAWPAPLIGLYAGSKTAIDAEAAATNQDQRCEAKFYIGEWLLTQSLQTEAIADFQEAAKICPHNFIEYHPSLTELERLVLNAGQPPNGASQQFDPALLSGPSMYAKADTKVVTSTHDGPDIKLRSFLSDGPKACRAALIVDETPGASTTYKGKVIWELDPSDTQSPPVARANVAIADAGFDLVIQFRKNMAAKLNASYFIDLQIKNEAGSLVANAKSLSMPVTRAENDPRGVALVGAFEKISDTAYLIGFARGKTAAYDFLAMERRNWLDIPVTLQNGRSGKISIEGGANCGNVLGRAQFAWTHSEDKRTSRSESLEQRIH